MIITGAKGGGGGSTFKQTPDNLRSEDTFEGVLGLGLGPFKGPTNGLKSIKVDGTAVENQTGELNFKDFIVNFADGDPLAHPQKVALRLGAGASAVPVNLALSNDTGSNPVWVTKTLPNTNANYIDLRFIVQQLYRQDKKGIYNETATLEIQMKPTGSSTWYNPTIGGASGGGAAVPYNPRGIEVEDTFGTVMRTLVPREYFNVAGTDYAASGQNYKITGKTTSPTVYELRIGVPSTGEYADVTWDVRVRLKERESYDNGDGENNVQEKRTLSWESIAAVYSGEMGGAPGWQGVSWIQFYGKASDQLTGVPDIEGEYDTKIVPVPPSSIYNPETRQWSPGIWDGSWEYAYTNDPAWAISDLISDSVGGVAAMAGGSYLNKWDAREASQWFSELVPDGDGGQHPRFSMNVAVTDKQKAPELVRYLAGAVGGLAWDNGNGEWRMKVDKPEKAVDIFTLDSIVGEFNYSHTDVDTRFNDITGKFLNAEMDYREDTVRIFDDESISAISRIGRKPTTIALVGCTNRQEAMRRVMMRLRSSCRETRTVSFTTNRRGRNISQLDHILIADGSMGDSNQRTTGRALSMSADRRTVYLRDNVRVESGVNYWVNFSQTNPDYAPNPTVQPTSEDWTKPLTVKRIALAAASPRGNTAAIVLDEPLPAGAAEYLSVALEAVDLPTTPKTYRVLTVEVQDDEEQVAISAIEVDVDKWDAVDNVSKEDTIYVGLRGKPSQPLLYNGQMLSFITAPAEQGGNVNLQAQWQRPPDRRVSGTRVRYQVNGGNWITAQPNTQLTDFALTNPSPGLYTFELTSVGRDGTFSLPVIETLEVAQQLIDAQQINYVGSDGLPVATVQDLQPREAGATYGAPGNAPVGSTTASALVEQVITHGATLGSQAQQLSDIDTRVTTEIGRVDGLIADTDALVTAEVGRLDGLIADTETLVTTEIERVDGLLDDTDDRITSEVTRVEGLVGDADTRITTEIGRVDDLLVTLRTDVDGNHATVTSDITTLQSDTEAQATAISGLSTRVGEAEAAIVAEQTARSDGDEATASSITALDARLQINTDTFSLNFGNDAYEAPGETVDARALFLEEQSVRASQNAIVVRDVNLLSARVGEAEADILTDRQARVDGDTALSQSLTALTTRVGGTEADIVSEQTARSDADSALASDLTALTGRVGDAEADIVSEQTARSDADSAIASDVAVLQGRVDDADAAVLSEQQARIDGDEAIASDLTALTSRVDDAEADIVSEQSARSTADQALAADLTALNAQLEIPGDTFSLNFGGGAYEAEADTVSVRAAVLEEQSVRASQNAAVARDVSILTARIGDNEADILSEQQARIDADGAIATDLTTLTTRVGDNEAAVTAQAASIDGLEARYGVTLNVNGHVTGFAQNNDGTTGSFTVVADEFAIVPPSGGAGTAPFIVDGGVAYIAQSYIKELAVDKIAGGTLGAEINVGAGKIIYDNGTFMKVTGVGFGSAGQFLEWFGPKMAIGSCTEANAITYLKTDGSAYFGGTLSAGTLKNAATSTSLAGDASLTVGPFGSNGNPIVLVTSYFGRSSSTLSFPGTAQGKSDWESAVATWGATATGDSVDASKPITCNVAVRIDRNGTTDWANLTITSGTERLSGTSPLALGEGTPGFLEYTREVSGTITSTDSAGGTTDRTFTATITTRSGVVTGTLGTQQLSLTATEE